MIDQDWITDFENRRDEVREEYQEALKLTLESLKPLIQHNENYLCYAVAKGWLNFTPEERKEQALRNSLVAVAGRAVKWEIWKARKLAFEILEEVNDHKKAAEGAEVLGLKF